MSDTSVPRPVTPSNFYGYACCGNRPQHFVSCGERIVIHRRRIGQFQFASDEKDVNGNTVMKTLEGYYVFSRRRDGKSVPLAVVPILPETK